MTNTDPADGYSEDLAAALTGVTSAATLQVGSDGTWSPGLTLAEGGNTILATDPPPQVTFTRGFAQDVTTSFALDGPEHDTSVLPKFEASLPPGTLFGTATTDAAGDAVLHLDPHD